MPSAFVLCVTVCVKPLCQVNCWTEYQNELVYSTTTKIFECDILKHIICSTLKQSYFRSRTITESKQVHTKKEEKKTILNQ